MGFILMLLLTATAEALGFEGAWMLMAGFIGGMAYEAMRKH